MCCISWISYITPSTSSSSSSLSTSSIVSLVRCLEIGFLILVVRMAHTFTFLQTLHERTRSITQCLLSFILSSLTLCLNACVCVLGICRLNRTTDRPSNRPIHLSFHFQLNILLCLLFIFFSQSLSHSLQLYVLSFVYRAPLLVDRFIFRSFSIFTVLSVVVHLLISSILLWPAPETIDLRSLKFVCVCVCKGAHTRTKRRQKHTFEHDTIFCFFQSVKNRREKNNENYGFQVIF